MYKEFFLYATNTETLTAGTGVAFQSFNIRIDSDADFEFNKTAALYTDDRIRVKYQDSSLGRYLTKASCNILAIAGSPLVSGNARLFMPFVWPRPHVISAGSNFMVEMADYSTSTNACQMSFHGSKVRPGTAPWAQNFRAAIPFIYPFSTADGTLTVEASSAGVARVEIDIDSHFIVHKISGRRTGDCNITISEGARGRDWSNAPVRFDNLVGDGRFPNILPAPRFISRGSVVSFTVQDLSAASNVIEIDLIGVKLYE